MPVGDLICMKGLSILFTLALLLLAHELCLYMKQLNASRLAAKAQTPSLARPEVQLEASTNARGWGPRRFPAFRADNRLRTWNRERLEESDNSILAF